MNPSEFRIRRGVTAAVLALSVCGIGAACGSGDGSDDASTSAASTGEAAMTPGGTIDACALIPAEKITSLMGTSILGESTGDDPDMPGCIWENVDTFESVSVEIGKTDTAINGTLPPPEAGFPDPTTPGPDGMRFLGNGVVEFAADKRANTVQVAVNTLRGEDADNAAIELAHHVSSQLDG